MPKYPTALSRCGVPEKDIKVNGVFLKAISKIVPQQNDDTTQTNEIQGVLSTILITHHQTVEILRPRKEPLDLPASSVMAKRTAILGGRLASILSVRGDHVDALLGECGVQGAAVVGEIADQTPRRGPEETAPEGRRNKGDLMRRSNHCVDGDRKTSAVCHAHELRTLAPLCFPNASAPFLAATNEPSIKHPTRSNRSSRIVVDVRPTPPASFSTSRRPPTLGSRWWQVWYRGKRSGRSTQRALERRIHSIPFITSRFSRRGLRRGVSV